MAAGAVHLHEELLAGGDRLRPALQRVVDPGPDVRFDAAGFRVYAPFGLNDLFAMIVRPNKVQITEAIYQAKVARWTACWPRLEVIPW